jgi:hypothetical protein
VGSTATVASAGSKDASVVASSVAERLGYEPFDSAAADTLKVTVLRKDGGLQAGGGTRARPRR